MVDLRVFSELLSPHGQEILRVAEALAPKEADYLIHFQSLSRRFPPGLTHLALETAILRREARSKFPFAEKLYLTRQALEQASSFEVASYRAERYRSFPRIADLGSSIGADSFALAEITPTLGVDIDDLRLAMASANFLALGLTSKTLPLQADLTSCLPVEPGSAALFFDPARRRGHQRFFSVDQYQPPLSVIRKWLVDFPALGVKISPGVNLSELSSYDAEVEFISLRGELKEAVLWFGPLKTTKKRATLLPGPHHLDTGSPVASSIQSAEISEPKSYLYEPDPAVIRSGLVKTLADQLRASQMDADIAYLTADHASPTPFARIWSIEDWFPFQLKRLRAYLRQQNIGRVVVKKRGSPLEPETLIHQLRLQGDRECILVLTHLRGVPIVIICYEL